MFYLIRLSTLSLTLMLSVSQAYAEPGKNESGKGKGNWERYDKDSEKEDKKNRKGDLDKDQRDYRDDDWWGGVQNRVSHGRFDVPPGHRPPPGMCRRWYPNLPPGQQPPPEKCERLHSDQDSYILYGERGYDPRYDWERARDEAALKDIPHVLLDILLAGVH